MFYVYILELESKWESNKPHYFLHLSIEMEDRDILSYTQYLYDYLRMYRPVSVIDRIPLGEGNRIADLDYIVLQYMAKHGIEFIRGGSYTSVYIKPHYTQIQWMLDHIHLWICPEDPLYDYFQEKWKRDRADEIFQNELRINQHETKAKDEEMYYILTHDSAGNEVFWNDYLYDITPEFIQDSDQEYILDTIKEKYALIRDEDLEQYDYNTYKIMLYTIINHIDQYAFHLSTHIYEEENEKEGPNGNGDDTRDTFDEMSCVTLQTTPADTVLNVG